MTKSSLGPRETPRATSSRAQLPTAAASTRRRVTAGRVPRLVLTFAAFSLTWMVAGDLEAGSAQRGREGQEETQITVAAEDELAYVRAIRADLKRRLGEPMETVELDLIMEGSDFSGTSPAAVRWDGDSSRLWFRWKRWGEDETGTFEYTLASGELRRLDEDEAEMVPPSNAVWDLERRRALWVVRDSLICYETESGSARPLLEGVNGARPVLITADGAMVVISYNSNLFAIPLTNPGEGPLMRQLTDIRDGQAPREGPANDHRRWLREQQLALFDVLQRSQEQREKARERSQRGRVKPLYLQGWRAGGLLPDPTLTWVGVQQMKSAGQEQRANVPNYVTASGFTEDIRTRTKVGDALGGSRVGVLEIATGEVAWADLGLEDREVSVSRVIWSPDGTRAVAHVRAQDNKDRWFVVLTPGVFEARTEDLGDIAEVTEEGPRLTLDVTLVAHDHDEAWINWSVAGGFGWMPGGEAIYFVSEREGTMHLYTVPAAGGEPTALTAGDFEVFSPRLTRDRSAFVFEASMPSPYEVQAYLLPLAGGQPEQLTEGLGRSNVTMSPDGEWLAAIGSTGNQPWELYVKRVGETGPGQKVTDSPSPAFKSYGWIDPPIVHFTAEDGTEVPARLYKPADPHPDRPAVIFVHGAGYMHNVHHYWSSYSREYSFHHLLMERGYHVLDIDYRGSAGYGRDWRTAIYRHMGGKDLSDQVDGARYLVTEHGIDPSRIGLYGGSYGGFITLMAMFTTPHTFAAGASLRPVTDWAAYNHGYTSNILNTPVEDPEAYTRSSPIYFAENLEGALLICHGLIDTNVHAQDSIRLAQRLIELRKEDWELALYPVENHGFREPSSWHDEYRRILKLFEENLKE